jgi:hypothetical protein
VVDIQRDNCNESDLEGCMMRVESEERRGMNKERTVIIRKCPSMKRAKIVNAILNWYRKSKRVSTLTPS